MELSGNSWGRIKRKSGMARGTGAGNEWDELGMTGSVWNEIEWE